MNSPTGTVVVDGERATILFERSLPYPIEVVWSALSDPAQLSEWFGDVKLEPREGGAIVVEAGPPHIPVEVRRSIGTILVWEPPTTLEYEWKQAIVEESTLRFDLRPEGDGTVLKLTHRWLSVRNAKGFAPGWHAYLDRLGAHLDRAPIPDWSQRFGEMQPSYGWQK